MRRRIVGILSITAAVGLGACSDGAGPSDTLTPEEAQAIAGVLVGQTVSAGDAGAPGTAALGSDLPVAAAPVQFTNEGSLTVPCRLGGSFSAERTTSGTIDPEENSLSLNFVLVQVHEACVAQPEGLDEPVTLNGDPNVTSTFNLSRDAAGAVEASGSIEGSVRWELGERSGTCSVSLSFSGTGGSSDRSINTTVIGTVCSEDASDGITFTPVS